MKKFKSLLALLLVGVLSTGCIKFNANMDIKKDKSMDFTIIYAFDKSVFGDQAAIKEEDMEAVKEKGFTVTKYTEGNMEGFTISKKIKNIDEVSSEQEAEYDLSGLMSDKSENKYIFKVVKGEDKNIYYAKFKFNANDSGLTNATDEDFEEPDLGDEDEELTTTGSNSLDDMDLSGLMQNLDLSFNVTLPNGAISNNATKAENSNKKLSWKLTTDKQEYIEFAFELSNHPTSNTLLYVGIGAGVLVLVGAVVVCVLKKKNNKNEDNVTIESSTNE